MEQDYNISKHSAIGMAPIDRFALDRKFMNFLEPGKANDELFFAESFPGPGFLWPHGFFCGWR